MGMIKRRKGPSPCLIFQYSLKVLNQFPFLERRHVLKKGTEEKSINMIFGPQKYIPGQLAYFGHRRSQCPPD